MSYDPANPMPQSIPGVHLPGGLTPLNVAMPWLNQSGSSALRGSAKSHSDSAARERAESRRQLIVKISRISDLTERTLRAVAAFTTETHTDTKHDWFRADEEALHACVPELWTAGAVIDLSGNPSWDSPAVARWFASRAPSPTSTVPITKHGVFGVKKPKHVPGWTFLSGSTRFFEAELSRGRFGDICITRKGEIVDHDTVSTRVGINAGGLRMMARLVFSEEVVPKTPTTTEQLGAAFKFMGS